MSGTEPYAFRARIDLTGYKKPLVVSYFSPDSVWHPTVNAKKIFTSFAKSPTAQLLSIDENTSGSDFIDFNKTDTFFIEMMKRGHGYDRLGTPEFRIHVKSLNLAMDHFLN